MRFINGVVQGHIRVNNAKRKELVKLLRQMQFKTHSELEAILPEKKKLTVVQDDDEHKEESIHQDEEVLQPGEVSPKEYDYLLTMPILNLTEEKVQDLQRQLKEKRVEYDRLAAMHIYEMWVRDLDNFLAELDKYEMLEEKDRLAHQNAENKGKGGKGRRKAANGENKPRKPRNVKGSSEKPSKKGGQMKKLEFKQNKPVNKDPTELSLMERLQMSKSNNKQSVL